VSSSAGVRLVICALAMQALVGCAPAQPPDGATTASKLELDAAKAYEAGTPDRCREAAGLWIAAADQHNADDRPGAAAAALRKAGRAYTCAGDEDAALAHLGRAAELDNAAASRHALVLLDSSPVYEPASRDIADDARFVGAVNDLLRALGRGETRVTSAEEAQATLETLVSLRLAPITIRTEGAPVNVELRRYRYSLDSARNAPWERVTTDVTLKRAPAAYHVRYRSPSTRRDTTLLYRCADGCDVLVR
jgi:hypothetical protein